MHLVTAPGCGGLGGWHMLLSVVNKLPSVPLL